MTPEQEARIIIDEKLNQSGWIIQNVSQLNLSASAGVAIREFPTSTGPVDYALFVDGNPVGVIEAKRVQSEKILLLLRSSLLDMQTVPSSGLTMNMKLDLLMRQLTS